MGRALIANRARTMRKTMTEPEVMLWTCLRGRDGEKPAFRRQHPFGPFILDFYCTAARLAVEVDGASHFNNEAEEKDKARDRWLERQGVSVMRIPALDVHRDLAGAADGVILRAEELIREGRRRLRLAPSTPRSAAGGPPRPASRGR